MRNQCCGQRKSLNAQLNSRLVRRIELYTKFCNEVQEKKLFIFSCALLSLQGKPIRDQLCRMLGTMIWFENLEPKTYLIHKIVDSKHNKCFERRKELKLQFVIVWGYKFPFCAHIEWLDSRITSPDFTLAKTVHYPKG